MLLSPSTTLLLVGSFILVRATENPLQPTFIPGVPTPAPMQLLVPALVDPRSSACPIQYVNGKQIIPAYSTTDECLKEKRRKSQTERNRAVEVALNAVKLMEAQPKTEPKCIKSVDAREQGCIKKQLLDDLKSKPEYAVTNKDNEVFVFKGGEKIAAITAIQQHFEQRETEPNDQAKIIKNAKQVYVFNPLGELLATKETKRKKPMECICPGQGLPGTAENTKLINQCVIEKCKSYDLLINTLSNSTITHGQQSDKGDKKDESKNKKDDDRSDAAVAA